MFDSLQSGLTSALKSLRGKGKLTESNMRDGLLLVEQSLLEADVSYDAVKHFMGNVTEQALGQRVLNALDPSQQLVGIVHEQLVDIMGPVDTSLHLKSGGLTVIMMCGLQGSGKTTTCGKLSRLLKKEGKQPMLCAADLQRPAAIDQLHVLGEQLGVPVYSDRENKDPVAVCNAAKKHATSQGVDVLILDTAGRLAIDQELMDQLCKIDLKVSPDQVYLVVDGMTGQDAVNSAAAFNKALELDGVVMTKLDGDARGGAILSVKHVTGVPVKFIGTGEQLESLEPFRPDGMAGRILGMGDIVEMVRTAQTEFDQEQMQKAEERLRKGEFTLDDFRKQLEQIAKPGLMQKMLGLMPGMGELKGMLDDADAAKDMRRLFGIIDSMTPAERRNPKLISADVNRRQRIANGSGVKHQEVNDLIKQFDAMASIMKDMAGKGAGDRMKMVRELQQGGMLDPGGKLAKQKKATGKRLTPKERAKLKKQREKELRKRKRDQKS
ncbi:MAG: signal recognition particle protein [Planctomycetales bacterium]|nr:signal recognition particle protein [Planctomycetales bacterium]